MSAFGGKADINGRQSNVRFLPKADIRNPARVLLSFGLNTRLACERRPFWNLGGNIGGKVG
jgi:hypothetical protein